MRMLLLLFSERVSSSSLRTQTYPRAHVFVSRRHCSQLSMHDQIQKCISEHLTAPAHLQPDLALPLVSVAVSQAHICPPLLLLGRQSLRYAGHSKDAHLLLPSGPSLTSESHSGVETQKMSFHPASQLLLADPWIQHWESMNYTEEFLIICIK